VVRASSSAVLCAVVGALGCGRGVDASADARAAADDGRRAVDSAATGTLRVMVFSERRPGEPEAAARVLAARPGEPVQELATGADGVADVPANDGMTVTVLQPVVFPRGVVGTAFATFVDVGPGMALTVGPRQPRLAVASTVHFVMPTYPGARFYTVKTPCQSYGTGEGTEGTLTIYRPCATISSATVVGQVRGDYDRLLAISVLDDVDLLAADGATIVMPAFDVEPVTISATIANVPTITAVPFPTASYRRGPTTEPLQWRGALPAVDTTGATMQFAGLGYALGDSAGLDTDFISAETHEGPGHAQTWHHLYQPGPATSFSLDAGPMMRAIFGDPTTTAGEVTWRESAVGTPPEAITVAIGWDDVRGVIVAPYTGPSLSFAVLPDEVRPATTPVLWELAGWRLDGMHYRTIASLLEQSSDFRLHTLQLPWDVSFWTSWVTRAWLPLTPAIPSFSGYAFSWDPDEPTWFRFATGEWIARSSPAVGWEADVDELGHLTSFLGAGSIGYHPTAQLIDGPVRIRVRLDDVTGGVDLVHETASWQITASIAFNIPGVVSELTCRTAPFTLQFDGNWRVGTDSEPATIPRLDGLGTQACAGRAERLNTAFALGEPGALLHFRKFVVEPRPAPTFE
jgi:hypothetical protein